jgi:putative transposase
MITPASEKMAFHVISRGNDCAEVFHDIKDYEFYLSLLKNYQTLFGFDIFHFSLMPNHVHLLFGCPCEQLSKIMKGINQSYTFYYKRRYGLTGHLWQNRYRRFAVNDDAYMLTCGIYIEVNAVRAGLCDKPEEYEWSSARAYATAENTHGITLDPAFMGLGNYDEERRAIYGQLTKMWLERPVSKKTAKKFFKSGIKSFHPFLA